MKGIGDWLFDLGAAGVYCHFIIRLKCNQCIKYKQRSTAVDDGRNDAIVNISFQDYGILPDS